jgi:hypothetical protein
MTRINCHTTDPILMEKNQGDYVSELAALQGTESRKAM